jgi:hypothetical protein
MFESKVVGILYGTVNKHRDICVPNQSDAKNLTKKYGMGHEKIAFWKVFGYMNIAKSI